MSTTVFSHLILKVRGRRKWWRTHILYDHFIIRIAISLFIQKGLWRKTVNCLMKSREKERRHSNPISFPSLAFTWISIMMPIAYTSQGECYCFDDDEWGTHSCSFMKHRMRMTAASQSNCLESITILWSRCLPRVSDKTFMSTIKQFIYCDKMPFLPCFYYYLYQLTVLVSTTRLSLVSHFIGKQLTNC